LILAAGARCRAIAGEPPYSFLFLTDPRAACIMPNTKSAAKRHRQSLVRRERNRARKSKIRTQIRKVREAIAAGDTEKAATEFRAATKAVDQGAAAGVVHANLAGRVKSRLSAAIKAAKAAT
jgi:small subunit ribosomal protein S20